MKNLLFLLLFIPLVGFGQSYISPIGLVNNSTITIEMKIGILILSFVLTLGIMFGAINMVFKFGLFRNPFKDKWGRIKDDVSRREQNIWYFFIYLGGFILVNILQEFISNYI